jgi:hypothetical protein
MLQETRTNIAYCYQRAEEARQMASRPGRFEFQQMHREAERRWLSLAHSYETAQRINRDFWPTWGGADTRVQLPR